MGCKNQGAKTGSLFFSGSQTDPCFQNKNSGLSACSDNLDFFYGCNLKKSGYHTINQKKTSSGNTERNQGCQKFQVQTPKKLRRWHQKKTPTSKIQFKLP